MYTISNIAATTHEPARVRNPYSLSQSHKQHDLLKNLDQEIGTNNPSTFVPQNDYYSVHKDKHVYH